MLQKLNERIQGVVAWVVIILVAITFTLFGIDYYMQSRHASNAPIEVNGEPISKQTYELNYRRTRQMRDPSQMTVAGENQLKQQIMDEMIVNTVSIQAAHANGFAVSDSLADSAILSIPQFQEDGHFSKDRYQQALSGALYTPGSFRKEVRQGMLLNQQRFAFIGSSFALPSEIDQFVKLYMQSRDYDYMQIPMLRFIKPATVSDQEINSFYHQHQKEFLSPEKVSVDYIRLSMRDMKEKIKISDEQIRNYYEENISSYRTPTQWKVAHILFAVSSDTSDEEKQQIKQHAQEVYEFLQSNPGEFEHHVKTISDDKISAVNGGVLPWIMAGKSEFDKALIKLTKPGQLSHPIKTRHGFEIFKLLAYKPIATKPFSEVKEEIKDQVITDQAQANYAQALEQVSDLSYQTPDSLEPVASALKLAILQSELFPREGGNTLLTKNKQVINAAFSHEVLTLGNNSEPVQLDNDTVVVLRVNKRIAATERTLDEVKPAIVDKIARLKAAEEAKQLGEQLIKLSQDMTQIEKFINENHLHWHEVTHATRDTDPSSAVINEMAFTLPRIGAKNGLSIPGGDYVVVHLKKINEGVLNKLDNEQVASITQQIESSYGMMDYDLYVRDLLNKAKVVKH